MIDDDIYIDRYWSLLIVIDQPWSGTTNKWREQKIQQRTTTDHCGSVYNNHCLTSKGIDQWYLWFVLLSFVYWQCFMITVEIKITTRESVSVYDRYWYIYIHIYQIKSSQVKSNLVAGMGQKCRDKKSLKNALWGFTYNVLHIILITMATTPQRG